MKNNNVIALIPARGSSKSIKKKNLLKINRKTLIENIFLSLKKSKLIDKIVCSTEDNKIIEHCKKINLETIVRPKSLSKDNSNIFYTAKHCIDFFASQGIHFKILLLAQPTSPFIKKSSIDKIIKTLLENKKICSCQTIHKTPHNYHYLNTRILSKNNFVTFKFKKQRLKKYNKQKKNITYNFGNLIACKINKLFKTKNFFCEPCKGIVIDKFNSYDLDNLEDFNFINNIRKFKVTK